MLTVPATEITDDFLDSTDHIAFQFSNLVQPYTVFLNVDRKTHEILNASTNTEQWFGRSVEDIVGRTLDDAALPGISAILDALKDSGRVIEGRCFDENIRGHDGAPLLCRVSSSSDLNFGIELELAQHPLDVQCSTEALQRLIVQGIGDLKSARPIEETINKVTGELRGILGYNRGLCYRFDQEDNGEVIAECTAIAGEEKYLGLHFPSRDIPRTARQMLLGCKVRTTIDQCLDCHQIYPNRDPHTKEYIDLTMVRSRGAAGSCREYYLNMNIRSTMVLPLIVDNRLWGLLAFHDPGARRVNPKLDEHLAAIAQCLAFAIERSHQSKLNEADAKGQDVVNALVEFDPKCQQWISYLESHVEELKNIVSCGGFLLRIAGEVLHSGEVPDFVDQSDFTDRMWGLCNRNPLISNRLSVLSPDIMKHGEVAAGAIAIPLPSGRDDIAIWLRPDQAQDIHWAGDPMSDIERSEDGIPRLCPRKSFEVWTKATQNSSIPWTSNDIATVTSASTQIGLMTLSWYASQTSQAKTQFLSCMSHEIRTPMTAILGYTVLLKEKNRTAQREEEKADEFIDIIQRNGEHLLSVIDDILDLAKIESGKLTVEQLPLATAALVKDIDALMSVRAAAKQLPLRVELATPVPSKIHSDPIRLRQILINLIGNAIKFTQTGNVILKVGCDKDFKHIRFEVVDTGIGLTQPQLSRLFHAFEQADPPTTRKFGGSGLGLQISKHLAGLLGGEITVQSEYGKGSTFRFVIPTGCTGDVERISEFSSQSSTQSLSNVDTQSDSDPLPLKGLKIMVMEDGQDNQRLLQHFLGKAGAELTFFENGKQGVEALSEGGALGSPLRAPFPFDLILSDMQMPEMDGYTATRMLRQSGCNAPIIALTAYAMQSNVKECLDAGCDDYLSKPFKKNELIGMCSKWRR